jgi:uncharacterized membrane protein YvlD (DUF360 family)
MKFNVSLGRIIQAVSILVVQGLTLLLLQRFLPGLHVDSLLTGMLAALGFTLAQAIFWLVFIHFFSWLPVILYPIFTFLLTGMAVMFVFGDLLPGVAIDNLSTALWITVTLSVVNAILGAVLSLDEDASFDRNVTARMVKKKGKQIKSDQPGFIFFEIDGLGEALLRQAIADGHMPFLKSWLDEGKYTITGWETDFTSQTGAMQTGILMGNNWNVPAYRWWDRTQQRIVMSGDPRDAQMIERTLSTGKGLLSDGGASRGNMFSGDATESILTMSTVMDSKHERGPGFYFYLFSPYILARLVSRFIIEVIKEWFQAWQQKRRKDKYRVKSRGPFYAFLRGFMGPLMQDLATFMVISDMLRGVPAVYALYAGYDDLAHFAGMSSPEVFEALFDVDRYLARLHRAAQNAPRPYHIVLLSDHGQTLGLTFENAYGISLEKLVDEMMKGSGSVYAAQGTDETWEKINVVLTQSINEDTRTAKMLRSMLKNKTDAGMVQAHGQEEDNEKARKSKVVVMGSGSAGLIYFTGKDKRQTLEEISEAYPDLLVGLVQHPGVGFILVKSSQSGSTVLGKNGFYFLDDDRVDGTNPLEVYGPNAARHLKRETSFDNCPDILVNTVYDPQTQEMCGFEDQVSHHGGLGGPQNFAFVAHPVSLPVGSEPIVTAEGLYQVLRGWRDQAQGL